MPNLNVNPGKALLAETEQEYKTTAITLKCLINKTRATKLAISKYTR